MTLYEIKGYAQRPGTIPVAKSDRDKIRVHEVYSVKNRKSALVELQRNVGENFTGFELERIAIVPSRKRK